jgi:membrane protein YqaA with SNARE-associated domain
MISSFLEWTNSALKDFTEWGYIGILIASFLASTILPLASEVVFTGVILTMRLDPWICVAVATVGNTLGGLTCYWMGHLGKLEWIERFLKIKKEKLDEWVKNYHKYGDWLVFFSFMPIIGDLIAVTAGYLRSNLKIVVIAMFLGKLSRYVFWLYFQGLFITP